MEEKRCYDCEVYQYHSTPRFVRHYKSGMTCDRCEKLQRLRRDMNDRIFTSV